MEGQSSWSMFDMFHPLTATLHQHSPQIGQPTLWTTLCSFSCIQNICIVKHTIYILLIKIGIKLCHFPSLCLRWVALPHSLPWYNVKLGYLCNPSAQPPSVHLHLYSISLFLASHSTCRVLWTLYTWHEFSKNATEEQEMTQLTYMSACRRDLAWSAK